MIRFVLRRLGVAVFQLFGLVLVVFFVMRLLPARPRWPAWAGQNASPEAYEASRHALGLDRPIMVQLASYLGVLPGTLGLLEGESRGDPGSAGRRWPRRSGIRCRSPSS